MDAIADAKPNKAAQIDNERMFAVSILQAEAAAISSVSGRLTNTFGHALDLFERCAAAGRSVVVSGLGKSYIIGQKISATLASLGVHSHSVHPSDALHGDLGRVHPNDVALLLSNSGETEELVALAASLAQDSVPVITITGGNGTSSLAKLSTVNLCMGTIEEAGDLGLAPTCSTTAMLALGDAIALTLARRRAVSADDFAKRHPGGRLGGLLRPVHDLLRFRVGENLAVIDDRTTLAAALEQAEAPQRRPGAIIGVDENGVVSGVFTDADLRRLILAKADVDATHLRDVMTRNPRTIKASAYVRDAVAMVRQYRQDELPVVDDDGKPVGLLDVQDLMALRVVEPEAHNDNE